MVHLSKARRKFARAPMVIAVIAVFALSGGLAACGSDDDDSGSSSGGGGDTAGKKVYLNAYAQEIQYFRDWEKGATARGDELGWDVSGEFGNVTPEQQVKQVENALVQQPDGIIVTPMDEESLIPTLQKAKDQGVDVITLGATVSDDSVVDSFVARDNKAIGVQKAQYVIDQLGGKGKVGIIHGIRGLTFSEDMADAYKETLAKAPGIEVVDGPFTGGFSADLGLDATANMLTTNPDLNAIIFDNDDLALGGAEAIKNAGIDPSKILVIGTDGGDPALKAVEDGTIDYTVNLCGYREGISAANTLNTLFETGSTEPRVVSDTEVFTTDNIADQRAKLNTPEKCN